MKTLLSLSLSALVLDGSGPRCASGSIFTVDHVKLQLIKVASQNALAVSQCVHWEWDKRSKC